MRRLRLGSLNFCFWFFKTRWAYGISSRVKGHDTHYLLMDFDELTVEQEAETTSYLKSSFRGCPILKNYSKHGFHCVVFREFSQRLALFEMLNVPNIDKGFVINGYRRGYWFLETKNPLPWEFLKDMTVMKVERVAQERWE